MHPEGLDNFGSGSKRPLEEELSRGSKSRDWRRRVRAAKRAARSELSVTGGEWKKRRHAESNVLSIEGIVDALPRIHCSEISPEEFGNRFEEHKQPVVITGLCDSWRAGRAWSEEELLRCYSEHRFKVGSDDEGYAVRLRLKDFVRYMHDTEHNKDDSPLYIFDPSFAERRGSKQMRHDFAIPNLFAEDLMQWGGEKRRPPYRWFVMGPKRSGSYIHIDPLATSAWNALLHGYKRWALFPPGTPKALLQPKGEHLEREAVSWFRHVWPLTQQPDWPAAKPLNVIQAPGETMFVPGGWWHTVMNLSTPTTAVTQNYASTANFRQVWAHSKRGRPKFSARWLLRLRDVRKDLLEVAEQCVNTQDPVSASSSSSSSSSSSDSSSSSSSSSSGEEETSKPAAKRRDAGADKSAQILKPILPVPSKTASGDANKESIIEEGPLVSSDKLYCHDNSRASSATRITE